MLFADRADAGRRLADRLARLAGPDTVVVGLPRGGVPVAFEVARALGAPLDVIVVRKLGVPVQPELGMGAVGEDGATVLNDEVLLAAGITPQTLAEVERRERAEVESRAARLRDGRERLPLAGRTVLIVDDGIATGSTARAACRVARAQGAARVVLAAPAGPPGVERRLGGDADEVVCLVTPERFSAVGQCYLDFAPTSDEEVVALLHAAAGAAGREQDVRVAAGAVEVTGHLTVPATPAAVVVFAHGSGSSRHSPRNRYVAAQLVNAGFATLLFDLLTVDEERQRENVFDIGLLARRLLGVTGWLRTQADLAGLPVGYFGASTGAGAALWAAAEPDAEVAAVVSRGGRPDLAGPRLGEVRAPTLLIVGGNDEVVIDLNRQAQRQLRCESRLEIVPGATHLFEEPGALEQVARLAVAWFAAAGHGARAPGRAASGSLDP